MTVILTVCGIGFGLFVLLNLLAARHAYLMLHFKDGGDRTAAPESLSLFARFRTLVCGVTILRPTNRTTPADAGMTFRTVQYPARDGLMLEAWHIEQQEAKGLVLLFHGYGSCKGALVKEASVFHELGYSALLVDFRGSGGSGGNSTTVGYLEADDVLNSFEYARRTWPDQKIVIYGSSMGGAALLRTIAVEKIDPDAIILEAVFDRMLTTVRNRFRSMRVATFPSAELLTFWGGFLTGFPAFKHNPCDYARKVTCPTLLLHGTADSRATIDQAENNFSELAGPKSFVKFDGVGHDSCLNADPQKWKSAVISFLATRLI